MSVPPETPQAGPPPIQPTRPAVERSPQGVLEFLQSDRGRWISPGSLIFALLLSCLPWVDVKCRKETMLTQSGIQAAFGGYSEGQLIGDMEAMGGQMGGEQSREEEDVRAAPLMILWLLVVLAGIGLGVGAAVKRVAFGVPGAAACGGAAALLLLIQVIAGFPVEGDVREGMEDNPTMGAPQPLGMPGFGAGDTGAEAPGDAEFGPPPEFDIAAGQAMEDMIHVDYTLWLWLAWLATLVPAALYGVEWKLLLGAPSIEPPT